MKKIFKVFIFLLVMSSCVWLGGCGKGKNNVDYEQLTNYSIDIDYDKNANLAQIDCVVDFFNSTDAMLKDIKLHLYVANFCSGAKNQPVSELNYNKAYSNGESFAVLNIARIMLNGVDVSAKYEGDDNDILVVELAKSLYPTERTTIEIEYNFKLPNCKHRLGYGDNTYNFGNFYPIVCGYDNGWDISPYCDTGDPFFSDIANYYVNISTNSDFTLASSGVILQEEKDGQQKFYKIEALAVRDFAFIMSEKYEVITKKLNKIVLKYFYIKDDNFTNSLECIEDAIKCFSEQFYKYPYKTYSVVQADFCYGGMEYPNLSWISLDIDNYDDYLHVIVHETAHQWWYNLVGNDEYHSAWLDESLTEYSNILFYDLNDGYNYSHKKMIKTAHDNFVFYQNVYEDVVGKLDTSMTRPISEFDTEPEYTYTIYVKGVLMYDSLYNLVGKKKFMKSLKCYAEDNAYKIAKRENLIASFEKTCKTDLENFFDCWLSGKVILN